MTSKVIPNPGSFTTITLAEAKELCIEAHKGQWRKPSSYDKEWNEKARKTGNTRTHIMDDGVRLTYTCSGFTVSLPYHTHPIAVSEMFEQPEMKILALLHDVVEDSEATTFIGDGTYGIMFKDKKYGLCERMYDVLNLLTKDPTAGYRLYLLNIAEEYDEAEVINALPIKIADMMHNMSSNPSEKQKAKYLKHLPIILNAL